MRALLSIGEFHWQYFEILGAQCMFTMDHSGNGGSRARDPRRSLKFAGVL
jgi:hypothetical protein